MDHKIHADSESSNSHRRKTEIKKQAILSILSELEQLDDPAGKPISKSEICRRAKVCRSFLRRHAELLESINQVMARKKSKNY